MSEGEEIQRLQARLAKVTQQRDQAEREMREASYIRAEERELECDRRNEAQHLLRMACRDLARERFDRLRDVWRPQAERILARWSAPGSESAEGRKTP